MNREEAIKLLRELYEHCSTLNERYIVLMEPSKDNLVSQGYQIHLKLSINDNDNRCVQEILERHNLAFKTIDERTIIYKPK